MVLLEGKTSNSEHHSDQAVAGALRRPIGGLSSAKNSREIRKMVRNEGKIPNTAFEELADINEILKHENIDYEELSND